MVRGSDVSPVGEAMVWVSRIMAIGLTMFLPGVAGGWVDARLGTWWIGPLGFVVGLGLSIYSLSQVGSRTRKPEP